MTVEQTADKSQAGELRHSTSAAGSLPFELVAILEEEFGNDLLALELFGDFLCPHKGRSTLTTRLVDVASARGEHSQRGRYDEQPCLSLTGAAARAAVRKILMNSRLPSNQSPPMEQTDSPIPELIGPVRRLYHDQPTRVHPRVALPAHAACAGSLYSRRSAYSPESLRDFLAVRAGMSPSSHWLATCSGRLRWPGDIIEQLRTSRGVIAPFSDRMVQEEAERMVQEWPAYERAILNELLTDSRILWAGIETSRRLGSLVEYPLGTVVLVVKPPGSHLEIEFKRAGRPGNQPLTVVHEREHGCVAPTHRLDGGSMGSSLRVEAASAAVIGRIYRLIHSVRAPISMTLAHRVVHEIPCAGGTVDLLDYFTDPEVFGNGFAAMREAMRRTICSFCREWESDALDAPGELGVTVAFLGQVDPVQAILGGSSSLRLELLATYLSDQGPERYFRQGLAREPTPDESRQFAEALLDEILGGYQRVDVEYRGHTQFIHAVLAEPANRRKADDVFLDLAAQAGRFWATLFAIKAYSFGESLVDRNVGLSSIWNDGAWRVRLVFMDHDMLSVPRDRFYPDAALWGCYVDVRYMLFDPPGNRLCELDLLEAIYRVDQTTALRGRSSFLTAAQASYQQTRSQLAADSRVQAMFKPEYLRDLLDWDDATAAFVLSRRLGRDEESSLSAGVDLLRTRGQPEAFLLMFNELIASYADFLLYFAVLFEPLQTAALRDDGESLRRKSEIRHESGTA